MWTSPYEPVRTGGTLHGLIAATAAAMGERPALIDGPSGAVTTYAAFASQCDRAAAGLAAGGVRSGDVVALQAANTPSWLAVALGAMAAGAAVSGISPLATAGEMAVQMTDSRASLLVTAPEELLASGGPAPDVAADDGAVALLPSSSGTTGLPKGVMLTHANVVASVRQINAALKLTPRDTLIAVAPFAHVMGFVVNAAGPLGAGAKLVTMPRFDFEAFLGLVERHRATVLIVPPPVMNALARHPAVGAHDLSAVELVVSGGAPLGADVQRAVGERLGAATRQGWGLTETGATATAPDRERAVTPGSVGRAMPSTQLRVVDPDNGADLGAGEPGELWVRGPQVMAG
jgi:acyl-CoA synthetase (AMP-forming)/AMP-acid ligase II